LGTTYLERFLHQADSTTAQEEVGSFWWRDIMNLSDHFFHDGYMFSKRRRYLILLERYLGVLQWKFPQLFSFALNKNISLKAFKTGQLERHFWRHLSIEASEQLEEMQTMLINIQSSSGENDKWSYIWNSSEYFYHKGYLQIIGIMTLLQWMWKSCVIGKHKFFFWLLLRDRLNTR
jgi:hypothetical protein